MKRKNETKAERKRKEQILKRRILIKHLNVGQLITAANPLTQRNSTKT